MLGTSCCITSFANRVVSHHDTPRAGEKATWLQIAVPNGHHVAKLLTGRPAGRGLGTPLSGPPENRAHKKAATRAGATSAAWESHVFASNCRFPLRGSEGGSSEGGSQAPSRWPACEKELMQRYL